MFTLLLGSEYRAVVVKKSFAWFDIRSEKKYLCGSFNTILT